MHLQNVGANVTNPEVIDRLIEFTRLPQAHHEYKHLVTDLGQPGKAADDIMYFKLNADRALTQPPPHEHFTTTYRMHLRGQDFYVVYVGNKLEHLRDGHHWFYLLVMEGDRIDVVKGLWETPAVAFFAIFRNLWDDMNATLT